LTLLVVTTSVVTYGAQLSTENTFTATLLFVGDVLPARGVKLKNDPLADIAPWLAEADLAIGNLEGTIALTGTVRPGPYRFRAEPAAALMLAEAGFDLLSLANNHALDYGPAALSETVAHLEAAGITPIGLKRENPVVERHSSNHPRGSFAARWIYILPPKRIQHFPHLIQLRVFRNHPIRFLAGKEWQ